MAVQYKYFKETPYGRIVSYAAVLVVDSLRISFDILYPNLRIILFPGVVFLPKSNMVTFTMVVALIEKDCLIVK